MIFLLFLKYFFICIICICQFFVIFYSAKTGKFLKTLILNGLLGIIIIVVINLLSKYLNIYIPINIYTLTAGGIFGIVGVCTILVTQVLIL